MFRILPSTYFWPITAHVAEDGKVVEKVLFEAEFKRHSQEKLVEIGQLPHLKQLEFIVVGWRGCKDVNGENVPFSEQALSDFIEELPGIAALLFDAYKESIPLVKRKN